MNFRNGFVSNSSSSSFVVFDNGTLSDTMKQMIEKYCEKIEKDEYRKRLFNSIYSTREENIEFGINKEYKQPIEETEKQNLPMFLSSFIPHGHPDYDVFWYNELSYDNEEGGHGLPYNEDWYICLNEDKDVYIRKSNEEMIEYIKSLYPTSEEFMRWSELEQKGEQHLTYDEYYEWLDLSNKIYYALDSINFRVHEVEPVVPDLLMKEDEFIKYGWTNYGLAITQAMNREIELNV